MRGLFAFQYIVQALLTSKNKTNKCANSNLIKIDCYFIYSKQKKEELLIGLNYWHLYFNSNLL